jgi:purine-nucleoside phosphorylase
VYGPAEFLAGAGAASDQQVPAHLILTSSLLFAAELDARTRRYSRTAVLPSTCGTLYLDSEFDGLGVAWSTGNPATTAVLVETLVHLGATHFVSIGPADAIRDDVRPGDVLVVSAALRDDGVSQHYVPAERFASASVGLMERLVASTGAKESRSWTLPLRYRATFPEIEAYSREGVATVDTETAALFAVAAARGVESGACLVVTGDLRDASAQVDWAAVRQSLVSLLDSVPLALLGDRDATETR